MPFKKGPNNTLRYYSSTTGRYVKTQPSLSAVSKRKKTYEEKLKERKEMLYNRARKIKDKYLFDVFKYLFEKCPNDILLINDRVYHKEIKSTREIDLMTKTSIIEVKSGKVRHKTKQFLAQKNLASSLNKEHIVYAPDITDKKYQELNKKGINVVRKKEELLERNK